EARLAAAMRRAGGAAAGLLWQFPVPQHLQHADRTTLTGAWDRLHSGRSGEELLRQMVLALRTWRPAVVVADPADAGAADALVAEAVQEAFRRAGDPKAFPEQLEQLGLEPWEAAKLYTRAKSAGAAQVVLDLNEVSPRLESSVRDFAGAAIALLTA